MLLQYSHDALVMCALPSFLKFPFLASRRNKILNEYIQVLKKCLNFLSDHNDDDDNVGLLDSKAVWTRR